MGHPNAVVDRYPVFEIVFFLQFFLVHGLDEFSWCILGEAPRSAVIGRRGAAESESAESPMPRSHLEYAWTLSTKLSAIKRALGGLRVLNARPILGSHNREGLL